MRFGLVGGGRWAQVHRSALTAVGAELAAVLVASEASAERVRAEWGVAAFTDLSSFLAQEFGAAIVASPNYLHADHAVAALEAGRHVLIEKPMALDLAGCDRIVGAARAAGKVAAVGLEMRFFKLFEHVKRLVEGGAVGRPLHLRLDLWRRPYRAGAGGWKSDPAKVGSSILEEPVHYLDLARWYLAPQHGEPSSVSAWATAREQAPAAWENLDVRVDFGGAQALVTRSIAAWGHQVRLQLVGDAGALQAEWRGEMDLDEHPQQSLTLKRGHRPDAEVVRVPVAPGGHAFDVHRQTQAFLSALDGGASQLASAADGRASVALCLAVEAALEAGTTVQP